MQKRKAEEAKKDKGGMKINKKKEVTLQRWSGP